MFIRALIVFTAPAEDRRPLRRLGIVGWWLIGLGAVEGALFLILLATGNGDLLSGWGALWASSAFQLLLIVGAAIWWRFERTGL